MAETDVRLAVDEAKSELAALWQRHHVAAGSDSPVVAVPGPSSAGAGPGAGRSAAASPSSRADTGSASAASAKELKKLENTVAHLNEEVERVLAQNVNLLAEVDSLTKLNTELRNDRAALSLQLQRKAQPDAKHTEL